MLDMTSTSRRTARQAARFGVAQSLRNARLVVLVWFVFLTLAWVAALPAWRWFSGALNFAPEGDRLLSSLNIALLRELWHYDRSPTVAIALGSSFTFFLFALILNPFVAGGTLGVLASPGAASHAVTRRSVTQRFVAEGVRCYWPFARILLLVVIVAGSGMVAVTAVFDAVGAAFDEAGRARASMWLENLQLLTWLLVFGLSSLLIDLSRIFMIHRDPGRASTAVRHAFVFLWRNAGAVVVMSVTFLVMLAVAIAIYNLIAIGITPLSWGLIAFTIVWQQLFALVRTTLRIALLAGLTELVDARAPRSVESSPADVAVADEPVYELPMLG